MIALSKPPLSDGSDQVVARARSEAGIAPSAVVSAAIVAAACLTASPVGENGRARA
jgi:hypothetical protein